MVWLMVPGPASGSPPVTFQLTLAAPPPARVAENCSYAEPVEKLLPLQPVQLVSMAAADGEMAKVEFDEPAIVFPAQPASKSAAGSSTAARSRKVGRLMQVAKRLPV